MNYLDLFSGIGGFALAIQKAGLNINKHYYSEIDKYAQQIYRKQFPGAIRLGDVTRINGRHGKIDIITGGFPCQSFSIAGGRRGFKDTRGTLFFEIERLSRLYKPSYMVLENVKGLFSHDGGNTIRVILDKLRRLDYTIQLLLLNTIDFGIPQNRERCFFICTIRGKRKPEISGIREAKKTTTFSSNTIDANYWKGIDNHGQRTCVAINKDQPQSGRIYDPRYNATTLNGEAGGGGAKTGLYAVQTTMFTEARTEEAKQIRRENQKKGRDYSPRRGKKLVLRKDDLSNCITSGQTKEHILYDGITIRRLTPTECERLQDYPDGWTKYGINENGEQVEISDTQRYKTCGNSITIKPAEEIFKSIKTAINKKEQINDHPIKHQN